MAPESRERILREAAKLFLSLGYGATTTRDIAAAVDIRQSSLFHHFVRKEEILVALIDTSLDGILDVWRWMQQGTYAADISLWTLIRHDTETMCSDPLNLGGLIRLPEARGPVFAGVWARRAELKAAYQRLVEAGAASGQFRVRDAALTTNLLFSLSEGTIDWFERDGDTAAARAAEDIAAARAAGDVADAALRMILSVPSRSAAVSRRGERLLTTFRREAAKIHSDPAGERPAR